MQVPITYHTFPHSGPHSTGLIWNGQKDTQLHGQTACRALCPAPLLTCGWCRSGYLTGRVHATSPQTPHLCLQGPRKPGNKTTREV